ncbi:G protein-coupled glucose receptor regulating Gpa2-domain-containing protein [Venturia nashicola]|nr:G protein-coupled glucose receptor regulating Gpa2-domain-containing protein [Venturia nashicola]
MAASKPPLSAVGSVGELHLLNIIILVISVLSALGSGWMILSFVLFESARTFRHQLILGLAISDFFMAANFMGSTTTQLAGHTLKGASCSVNGFATQWFVVQTDYWVLMIAVCTFSMLSDCKAQSKWIKSHRWVIWGLPWGLSVLWATIGLMLSGYGNIGAWCWFTKDRTRLLVNFIPRWLIIIAILTIYIRLYFIIYRAHERFISLDVEASGSRHSASHSVALVKSMANSTLSTDQPEVEELQNQQRKRISSQPHSRPAPTLKKLAYQMLAYPLIYMLIWIIPTTIRIYQATTGKPAPFAIATVDKSCIVIQGFADAVIYGFNKANLAAWKEWIFDGRR